MNEIENHILYIPKDRVARHTAASGNIQLYLLCVYDFRGERRGRMEKTGRRDCAMCVGVGDIWVFMANDRYSVRFTAAHCRRPWPIAKVIKLCKNTRIYDIESTYHFSTIDDGCE